MLSTREILLRLMIQMAFFPSSSANLSLYSHRSLATLHYRRNIPLPIVNMSERCKISVHTVHAVSERVLVEYGQKSTSVRSANLLNKHKENSLRTIRARVLSVRVCVVTCVNKAPLLLSRTKCDLHTTTLPEQWDQPSKKKTKN